MDQASVIAIFAGCGSPVDALRQEHLALDTLLDLLKSVMDNGEDKSTILGILDQATIFFRFHFEHEERHLFEKGDPDLELHAEAHKHIREHLISVQTALKNGKIEATLNFADLLEMVHNHVEQWTIQRSNRF
jgi:hemerythrin